MRNASPLNHIPWRVFAALLICLWTSLPAKSDSKKDREKAAKSLAEEIEQAQFHKIYVPDFLDPSRTRTEKGCFFASAFSTDLAKAAHNFKVVNRIAAQKQLNELHISAQDLLQPETLAKAAKALGADAVIVGSATVTAKDADLLFSLRDASSAKEVYALQYHEKLKPTFSADFPAIEVESDHFFYFPNLDGVSNPKCIYCPNPDYTDEARANKFQGSVMLSIVVDEKGAVRDVRVVQDPGSGLAQKSIEALRKWRLEPSRDPQGNPVTIRVAVETVFRLC